MAMSPIRIDEKLDLDFRKEGFSLPEVRACLETQTAYEVTNEHPANPIEELRNGISS